MVNDVSANPMRYEDVRQTPRSGEIWRLCKLRNMMITKKEIINNPENWRDTKGLNLDCFDEIHKISNSFYLKEKNKDEVLFGNYNPDSKSFDCYRMGSIDKFSVNRENISHFISLPAIDFDL